MLFRSYRHVQVGYNFRLTDIASALGRVQLSKLPASVRRRRQNARILSRGLADLPGIKIPEIGANAEHAFCLYTICLDSNVLGFSREQFRDSLARQGIETAVHYPLPLHRQPIFRGYGRDRDFPVSNRLAECVVSLPVHPELTRRDLEHIAWAVRKVARSRNGR